MNESLIFEEITNNIINLNQYPNLKKIVDKLGGINYTAHEKDFQTLLFNTPETIRYIDRINKVLDDLLNLEVEKNADTKIVRVLNTAIKICSIINQQQIALKSNSKIRLTDQDYKLYVYAHNDFQKLMDDVSIYFDQIKYGKTSQKSNSYIPPILSYQYIEQSKFLKNFTKIVDTDGKTYYLTNDSLNGFSDNTPENEKYYDAIMNNNTSLPSGNSSKVLTVYSAWKILMFKCQESVRRYQQFMNLSKTADATHNNTFLTKTKDLSPVESVQLKSIPQKSFVELSYYAYDTKSNLINKMPITILYNFFPLTKNYELVNTNNKNEFFTFIENYVPDYLKINEKYRVSFNNINIFNGFILITGIKVNNSQTISKFNDCNAIDELKKIITTIRENT